MARLIVLLALCIVTNQAYAAPVVIAVASAAASSGVFVGAFSFWGFVARVAVGLALNALSGLLAKKPTSDTTAYSSQLRDRQLMIRSNTEPHRIIYGRCVVSGPLIFASSTGSANDYLHLVIALAGHECQKIGDIWLNDAKLDPLDGSGNVTTGTFANLVTVKKHLGAPGQTVDSVLSSEVGTTLWDSSHTLSGISYLYVKLKYDTTAFPNGVPNIKAEVWGKKVYDPRTTNTVWSDNWALCVRDYLTSTYGLGCDTSEIDNAIVVASANICDERVAMATYSQTVTASGNVLTFATQEMRFSTGDGVTIASTGTLPTGLSASTTYYVVRVSNVACSLATNYANALQGTVITLSSTGSGTITLNHIDQARYTCNGSFQLDSTPMDIIKGMLTAAAGACIYSNGQYRIFAGAYSSPIKTLDEDDLRAQIELQPRTTRKDLYNAVKGTYADPAQFWQATDFPMLTNSTYETQDGGLQIVRDIQLPYTINQVMAQRLAKIHLEKSRQSITVKFPAKLTAFNISVWDRVQLNIALLGWSGKVFLVTGWQMSDDGGIDLMLQEDAASSYAWNSGNATWIDPAPDSNFIKKIDNGSGVPLVTTLPVSPTTSGQVVQYSADSKLYRWVQSGASGSWQTYVDGSDILAASITAGKINVSDLSAINASLGTINAGSLTLGTNGYIRQGQLTYNLGSGFWLGDVGGTTKFSMGNASQGITWDGTTFTVNGQLIATGNVLNNAITNTGNAQSSSDYSVSGSGWSTILSLAIQNEGYPVIFGFDFGVINPVSGTISPNVRVVRDSVPLISFTTTGTGVDSPSAGAHTYTLQMTNANGSDAIVNSLRALWVIEVKR